MASPCFWLKLDESAFGLLATQITAALQCLDSFCDFSFLTPRGLAPITSLLGPVIHRWHISPSHQPCNSPTTFVSARSRGPAALVMVAFFGLGLELDKAAFGNGTARQLALIQGVCVSDLSFLTPLICAAVTSFSCLIILCWDVS